MRWLVLVLSAALAALFVVVTLAVVLWVPGPAVLIGAGDVAACGSSRPARTAVLLDRVPGTVFAAGDLAYPDGTVEQLRDCFDRAWGRFRERMVAVPGNHEYHTSDAAGYRAYFGLAPSDPTWSAKDVGSWRLYLLDANCDAVGCGPDSHQVAWLRADLAANPRLCQAAIWHQPRFSSGVHGDDLNVASFWDVLYTAGADVVINGHDHDYERFAPLDPGGALDDRQGIREFIVGTGGIGDNPLGPPHAGSEATQSGTDGVLKLSLSSTGYDWQFLPVDDKTYSDVGHTACHGPPVVS